MQKECDQKQRFALRKLSVGLASVLVGVSFMAISAGQTVHADSLQSPGQSDLVTQKANSAIDDSANANKQNQVKNGTAQTINHVDPNSNLQQNADKNEADTLTNVATYSKEKTVGGGDSATAKDDASKSQKNVAIDQERQTTVAFAVKKNNKAITANMLEESKVADAQIIGASGADVNKGVDPLKFVANGGYDPKIWGTMDISKWKLDRSGNITGYTGDMAHIIIPNSADFAKAGKNYRQISISSYEMKKLGSSSNRVANTLAVSLTNDKKVKAANADWSHTFLGSTLKQANLEGLDTSKVTNMGGMFSNSIGLTSLDVANWNTSKVTDMSLMFSGASSLISLDVSNWNTGNVTDMNWMFSGASGLTSLDVANWDTSNVTDMSGMFNNASGLTSLDLSNWNTSNITDMHDMFSGASSLTNLDVAKWDTIKVTDMHNMFSDASSLTSLDVSNWDTSNVANMNHMFGRSTSLKNLDVSKWKTGNVADMNDMFSGASGLTSLDVSNWDTSKVTDMYGLFEGASSLTSLDVSKWNTSNVTDMGAMFSDASSLISLDVTNWDTSKVTDMSGMFKKASCLMSLDVSKWNTSNVTNMAYMFDYANSLTELGVSKWDTSKVTDMSYMFSGASSLINLDVSSWNTGKVTNMSYMFDNIIGLTSLGVSNWDTSKVANMSYMFAGANGLTSLDLSKWDTGNVTDMSYMFVAASKLTLIVNNTSGWQHATDNSVFSVGYIDPVVITNNANILMAGTNGNYTIDNDSIQRSVIFDSANSALKLPIYKGYTNYTSDADRLKYATDVIKVYNDKVMQDYSATHTDKMLKYADDQDMNDPIALARAKFVTIAKVEKIIDNPENHNKLHATATREYIIHNIDGSTTTITQSINYHRTGKHNLVTNEDTFTEWIYSPDENSVVVVVTKDKMGKAIANPIAVEGDNCIERDGKAYFGSIKIKPKAGFKLAVDKSATAKLNLQAKLASRLLPSQFFVLKIFAPMPPKTTNPTKQVTSANSIKAKQDHTSVSAEPITSANAIKQDKDVIVKQVVKPIELNEQTAIHDQTHAGSPINGFANVEAQLADVQNNSMTNSKQSKPDVNNQGSMQIANSSAENSQKSAENETRLQNLVTRTNGKVKPTETMVKSADSCQNQNKKVLAEKTFAKPATNISAKAEKVAVKPAVNIPTKVARPAIEKIALIAEKQTNINHSLPQTSSTNDSDTLVAIGLIMVSLDIALTGIKKRE